MKYVSFSYYSEIRKMQGAIIGGSIGGVAFIGIVVGIIALVRWKRYLVLYDNTCIKYPIISDGM